MTIIYNYNKILDEIKETALKCGRNPDEITLISVSKTFPIETVQQAVSSGITILGENKVQEANQKYKNLTGDFSLHLIGHLQSNKAKDAVKIFDLIHSIDKESTAQKVNNEAAKINKIQKVLIQANTSGEISKSGTNNLDAILELAININKFPNLELLGLMTIAPFTENNSEIHKSFTMLRKYKEQINNMSINITELSMGMSADYKIAIEEGASMLRIGSAIFGARDYT